MKIEVFDLPMCCTSGVCGSVVDPALAQFAADLEWFKRQGVTVTRHNLAQEPMAFDQNDTVREALQADDEALPLILVNGQVVSRGKYPRAEELALSLCVSIVARGDSPAKSAPAVAALTQGASQVGTFWPVTKSCCGPRNVGGKGARCCS